MNSVMKRIMLIPQPPRNHYLCQTSVTHFVCYLYVCIYIYIYIYIYMTYCKLGQALR
jgi:hypothetical protein